MRSITPPEPEPLEVVLPRLRDCMSEVVEGLRAHGVAIETSRSFLLDLTDWPFEVPKTLNGIPVQMSFAGSVPGWADRVRYHLHVYVIGDRRWSACEPPKGFNIPRIVARITSQLETVKYNQNKQQEIARNRSLAETRLARLGEAADIAQEGPFQLHQDNLRVEGLPDAPDEVLITVKTSHANAEKIAREFRFANRRSRKLENR